MIIAETKQKQKIPPLVFLKGGIVHPRQLNFTPNLNAEKLFSNDNSVDLFFNYKK